jgi:hypothetical protein
VTILCSRSRHRGAAKNLRLRSMVCAARHSLPRVMLLSKVWGKRRVSACASIHHCHWDWHSGRICTVVFITRGGEWDSLRPNALNVQRAAPVCLKLTAAELSHHGRLCCVWWPYRKLLECDCCRGATPTNDLDTCGRSGLTESAPKRTMVRALTRGFQR